MSIHFYESYNTKKWNIHPNRQTMKIWKIKLTTPRNKTPMQIAAPKKIKKYAYKVLQTFKTNHQFIWGSTIRLKGFERNIVQRRWEDTVWRRKEISSSVRHRSSGTIYTCLHTRTDTLPHAYTRPHSGVIPRSPLPQRLSRD